MARDGIVASLNIDQAYITPLLTDPKGGSPTYGTPIYLPGIQEITLQPEVFTKELTGDAQVIDDYTKIKSVSGTIKFGKLSMPVLAQILNGTTSNSGSSPNEAITLDLAGTNLPGYWKLEGQVKYLGNDKNGEDLHLIIWKCKFDKFQTAFHDSDYSIQQVDYKGLPRLSDSLIFRLVENQTAVAISTGATPAAPSVSSVTPADASSGAGTAAVVVWTFANPLNLSCITSDNFELMNAATGALVASTLSYNSGTNAVTLTPNSALAATTAYIAVASTGVQDPYGQKMAAASKTRFTT